ncbi:MAG: phosphoglycolate phosphatase [Thermodesulfobacteriota bacterium]
MRLRLLVLGLSFRHLIFDLDGTLIDSAADLAAAANATLEEIGLPRQDARQITGFIGEGARRLVERSLLAAGGPADQASIDAALAIFLARYAEHMLDTTVPYPGIPALLERLHAAGVLLSVSTNKPQALSMQILADLGLAEHFAAVIGGDSLPRRKPDPACVRLLVERAKVPLEETLLVGDSLIDVATARAASVPVCAVAWGVTARATLEAAGPDYLVERPDEIVALAVGGRA